MLYKSDSATLQTTERRATRRRALRAKATVHVANQKLTCTTHDLSQEGIALVGHRAAVPEGTFMRVQFHLPREEAPIDLDGVLVRTRDANNETVWGLKLFEPSSSALAKIERYVGRRPFEESQEVGAVLGDFSSSGVTAPSLLGRQESSELRGRPQGARKLSPQPAPQRSTGRQPVASTRQSLDPEIERIYQRAIELVESALEGEPKKHGRWLRLRRNNPG